MLCHPSLHHIICLRVLLIWGHIMVSVFVIIQYVVVPPTEIESLFILLWFFLCLYRAIIIRNGEVIPMSNEFTPESERQRLQLLVRTGLMHVFMNYLFKREIHS